MITISLLVSPYLNHFINKKSPEAQYPVSYPQPVWMTNPADIRNTAHTRQNNSEQPGNFFQLSVTHKTLTLFANFLTFDHDASLTS